MAAACGGYGSVQPTPAIAIQLNVASVTLLPGQHGDVTVSLFRTNYTGTVDLFVEGNVPTGVSSSFSRAPLPNEVVSTTLRLTAADNATAATGSLVLRARGSGVADQTATILITIAATGSADLGPQLHRLPALG
jgi:hypothetical protein